MQTPQKPHCHGTNATGQPCKAWPLRDHNYCRAHDPQLPATRRFGSAEQASAAGKLGGRPRRPREIDLIQEVAEERKAELRAVFTDGLVANRSVVVGDGKYAHLESMPDHAHRLKVAAEMLDRLHGKPRAAGDSVDQSVTVQVALVTDPQLRDAARVLRQRVAASRSSVPAQARQLPAGGDSASVA